MDLSDHLRVVVANWWRILLVAAVVGVGTYAWSNNADPVFTAESLLSVAGDDVLDPQTSTTQDQLAFRAEYFAEIGMTSTVAGRAAELEQLPYSDEETLDHYSIVTTDTSGLLLVRASDNSPEEAESVARGVAGALGDVVNEDQATARQERADQIERRIAAIEDAMSQVAEGSTEWAAYDQALAVNNAALIDVQSQGFFRISVVTQALASTTPVSPRPGRDATLFFLVAFIVTAEGLVVARAFSDRLARTTDAAAVTELTGLPVLAMVPRGIGPDVVEAFRTLRTNLMLLEGAGRPRTVAVVSPQSGFGKSFVSMNLAEAAAGVDARVVLIDADLRRPVLHTRLRCNREPGLSEVLRGGDIAESLHAVPSVPGLRLIPSGATTGDTVGMLGGRAFRQLLDGLDAADLVVIDTPPGAAYADALAVAAQCDAAIIVLDARSTRRRPAKTMVAALERTGATVVGAVVNSTRLNRRDTYGYERT
ncbi:MAG: polysaccharide biosynthesis tyrosine autokinase [Acidimicrobiia bacterium]|nr:polysaccharide biosynthesis tyrosine autokinase [Acidimicrobiia bacterium]